MRYRNSLKLLILGILLALTGCRLLNEESAITPTTSPLTILPIPTLCSGWDKLTYYAMKSFPVINPTVSKLNTTIGYPIDSYEPYVSDATSIDSYSIEPMLPRGLDLDSKTGKITGTPSDTELDNALFIVTVNYKDYLNVSKQAACKFTYTVSAANIEGTFNATGSLNISRNSPLAVTLVNGKVLVMGGKNGGNYLQSAELYDPVSGTFSETGSMKKYGPKTATVLQNGKVIVSGGYSDEAGTNADLGIEIYDPLSGTFNSSGVSLNHQSITAALLENGKILFLEGPSSCGFESTNIISHSDEIFDPTNNTISTAGFRGGTSATVLNDGKVLIKGFQGCGRGALFGDVFMAFTPTSYLYNSLTMTFTPTTKAYDNYGIAPTPSRSLILKNGNVLFSEFLGNYVQLMEVYHPNDASWTTPYGIIDDYYFSQTPSPLLELDNGTVLIADYGYSVAHFYDPLSANFTAEHVQLIYNHGSAPAVVILNNGKPLIIGGKGVEYYNP